MTPESGATLWIVGLGRSFRRGRWRIWLLALAVAVVAASAYWYVEAQTIAARCGEHPLGATSGYRHEWNWSAFAYECIYTDGGGQMIARHFPNRPGVGDR
jgi:hypothetical protein